jgi:hypothetical protein
MPASHLAAAAALCLCAAAAPAPAAAAAAANIKPHVVMIVIDDLGFDDMGFRMELNGQACHYGHSTASLPFRRGVVIFHWRFSIQIRVRGV